MVHQIRRTRYVHAVIVLAEISLLDFRNMFLSHGIYIIINWWRSFAIRHLKFSVDDVARQGLLLPDRVRESSYLAIGTQCIRPEDTFGV